MTLAQQLGSINTGTITGSITSVLNALSNAHPTIIVDGHPVPLDLHAAAGIAPLIEAAQHIPTDPKAFEAAVRNMLGELGNVADIPELHRAVEVAQSFERIAEMLTTVAQQAGGDPATLVERLLSDAGGLQQIVGDVISRFLDAMPAKLPDEIKVPMEAVQLLSAGTPTDAAHLADIITRFIIGVDLQALREPSLTIDASVALVLAGGGDLGAVGSRFQQIAGKIRAVVPMLHAAAPDVATILSALADIRADIDALFRDLPAAIHRLASSLEDFDTAALITRLTAALQPVISLVPNLSHDLMSVTVEPLRAVGAQIDALTPADLKALFDDVVTRFQTAVDSSGIGETLEVLDQYRDLAIDRLRRIELHRFRDEIVHALSGLEARINQFAFTAPQLLTTQLETVRQKIAAIDTHVITAAVQAVKEKIEGLVHDLPIATLRDEIQAQFGAIQGIVTDLLQALDQVKSKLDELAAQVDGIDFNAAGAEAREVMIGIRTKVQEVVGSSDVPAPARAALSLAAQGLKQIDFHAEVSAPIDAQLDKIDPSQLLAPLRPVVDQLHALLQNVTPSALVVRLDQPFLDAVALLEQFKPSELIGTLSREFARLLELIDHADPRVLVQPLQVEFEKVVDVVRRALNPDPIFQPLEDVYHRIVSAVDAVDPEKLLGGIVRKVADMPKAIGDSMQTAVAQHVGGAAAAVAGQPGDFKFGDLVRPFAMLIHQMRDVVSGVSADVLGGAIGAVTGPMIALQQLADPENGALARVIAAINERIALLDPSSGSGPGADLAAALHELQVTIDARADLSADVRMQLGGGAASVQLDARMSLLADARAELDTAYADLLRRIAPAEFVAEMNRAATAIAEFVPAPLLTSPNAAPQAIINALFDSIDPTPLVAELDALTDRIRTKLAGMAVDLVRGIIRILDVVFGSVTDVMPVGLIGHLHDFMEAIRAELAALDPAPIREEMHHLVESVIHVLDGFSPAALAAQLGTLFDAIKARLRELDPAALVGDTTVLDAPFNQLKTLRPSLILQPLTAAAQQLETALESLLSLNLGEALVRAVVRLRATIEAALDDVLAQFQELLAFLEGGGTNVSATASVSI